ncbi:MAG: DMT family transporter, partial [Clostridia bacterium]|nr:DMT family transporter [Clostridia bacterium]
AAANLQQAGIGATDPGKAGFITSLYVVLVPILGIFLHRRAPYTVWIGISLSLVGLYLLCITDYFTIAPSDMLILLCALFFALQILLVDRLPEINGMHLCCAQLFVVAVISTVLMFLFEAPSAALIIKHWFPLVYIGVFSSAIAYTLQIVSQKGSNPTVVSLLLCLESVFAVLTGWVIQGDTLSTREIVGCVLMFGAVLLASMPIKAKESAE